MGPALLAGRLGTIRARTIVVYGDCGCQRIPQGSACRKAGKFHAPLREVAFHARILAEKLQLQAPLTPCRALPLSCIQQSVLAGIRVRQATDPPILATAAAWSMAEGNEPDRMNRPIASPKPTTSEADAALMTVAAQPTGKRAPLSRQALDALREAILTGRLGPGDRLIEERLSADLGMSRVPIREAIKQLVAEGLAVPADKAPGGRGAQVAALTPDFAAELIEVRAVLEGLNARLAARHRDAEIVARIRALLDRGKVLSQLGPPDELAALNAAFHELLADAGANRVLQELMRPLRERTELVFRRNSAERAALDWQEHAMILTAVAEGDEELAALLSARHVHRAARARL
jgi:DNA-binding GntR family transcriptional regulator